MKKSTRLLVIVGCHGDPARDIPSCPYLRSAHTPGAGYAIDYWCTAANITKLELKVNGYVEWESDMRKPGDFPKFCPLPKNERGYRPRPRQS